VPFQTRVCSNPACALRFPVDASSTLGDRCPLCRTPTEQVDTLYESIGAKGREHQPAAHVVALLDNVRSLRNVGGMFRTADGAGLRALHLGGFTPTPEHPALTKTALGAEAAVPWRRWPDGLAAAEHLRAEGYELWALESGPRAEPLDAVEIPSSHKLALVVGHEVSGIDPRIVECCARVVEIPMFGVKTSLNVGVAFGIAAYWMTRLGPRSRDVRSEG
jgi:tRNA G18 (ribose-2'-O)-methylase SpoU